MDTRIYALLTSTNLPSSPTRSSSHENEGMGTLTAMRQGQAKVVDIERIRGSEQGAPWNSLSAMNSTKPWVASDWTVSSLTSVPTAPQVATLNPIAHEK